MKTWPAIGSPRRATTHILPRSLWRRTKAAHHRSVRSPPAAMSDRCAGLAQQLDQVGLDLARHAIAVEVLELPDRPGSRLTGVPVDRAAVKAEACESALNLTHQVRVVGWGDRSRRLRRLGGRGGGRKRHLLRLGGGL